MGLFRWMAKRGVAGKIATSVFRQYRQMMQINPSLKEEDICKALLIRGYVTGKELSEAEEHKLSIMMTNDCAYITTLPLLCMAILYIETDISPDDGKVFDDARDIVFEVLREQGYQAAS